MHCVLPICFASCISRRSWESKIEQMSDRVVFFYVADLCSMSGSVIEVMRISSCVPLIQYQYRLRVLLWIDHDIMVHSIFSAACQRDGTKRLSTSGRNLPSFLFELKFAIKVSKLRLRFTNVTLSYMTESRPSPLTLDILQPNYESHLPIEAPRSRHNGNCKRNNIQRPRQWHVRWPSATQDSSLHQPWLSIRSKGTHHT